MNQIERLFDLLENSPDKDPWKNKELHEALKKAIDQSPAFHQMAFYIHGFYWGLIFLLTVFMLSVKDHLIYDLLMRGKP